MQPNVPQQEAQQRPLKATGISKDELRKDFMKYTAMATKLVFSPETRGAIMGVLKTDQDPVRKVANTTVMVMQRLDGVLRKEGLEIVDTVKIFAGHEVIKMVSEYAEAGKLFRLNDDLQLLASSLAAQDYVNAEAKAGRINKKILATQIQADMRKMPEKDRKGVMQGTKRVAEIARKYNNGKGSISTAIGGKKATGLIGGA